MKKILKKLLGIRPRTDYKTYDMNTANTMFKSLDYEIEEPIKTGGSAVAKWEFNTIEPADVFYYKPMCSCTGNIKVKDNTLIMEYLDDTKETAFIDGNTSIRKKKQIRVFLNDGLPLYNNDGKINLNKASFVIGFYVTIEKK